MSFALDPTHPNADRWQAGIDRALHRGRAVCALIETRRALHGLHVLDLGSGVGGTVAALRERGALPLALDRDGRRLARVRNDHPGQLCLWGDALALPLRDSTLDGVVMQDVLEHLSDPARALREVARVLKPGGFLYLSTPLRWALPNLISDPHWGLPLLSFRDRDGVRRRLARVRPADATRGDLAALQSGASLLSLLADGGFSISLLLREVAEALLAHPEGFVWAPSHLRFVRVLRHMSWATRVIRNRPSILNRILLPTWYLYGVVSKGPGS